MDHKGLAVAADERTFEGFDWTLFVGLALTWGSSFLFIAVGLEAFPPAVITLLRIAFGAATLAIVPAARRSLPRAAWPRITLLGVVWVTLPLLLFPLAQLTVSSSLAGMINGAVPLTTAVVAAVLARRLPPSHHRLGLLVGLAGVIAISAPALSGADASLLGVVLLVAAVSCYGIANNVIGPLQRAHGALPVMLRAQLVGLVLVAPLGLVGLDEVQFAWPSLAAVAVLGCAGTGLALAAMATLVGRVGATRASVAIYFIPVVAIVLGVVVLGETVVWPQMLGTALVIAGARLTTRAASQAKVPEPELAGVR
jgi:drug/metabolite transporter (DMT)-like permease